MDLEFRQLDSEVGQQLALLRRQLLTLLAQPVLVLGVDKNDLAVVNIHRKSQLLELLLQHGRRVVEQHLVGYYHIAWTLESGTRKVRLRKPGEEALNLLARSRGEQQPDAALDLLRDLTQIIGVFVFRPLAQRDLQQLVLSQQNARRLVLAVVVAEMHADVLELVASHVFVREEVDLLMIIHRIADLLDVGRLVLPRRPLFRLSEMDELSSLGSWHVEIAFLASFLGMVDE
mmetsp:Transcript_16553/g.45862  ORF Transcript_16553/g.45862 Transcript_16553/m.45862 type:complete len:231 (+) Transcript_16553:377-1069(+)